MDKEYLQGYEDLTEATRKVRVFNIEYDINDEDLEENDTTEEELLATLPQELVVEVSATDDLLCLEDEIVDQITEITGFCVNDYDYELTF